MSTRTIEIMSQAPASMPFPLSPLFAGVQSAFVMAGRFVMAALHAEGEARARRELLAAAERCGEKEQEMARFLRDAARRLPIA